MNSIWDLVLYEWCIREKNLTLFLNTNMHGVEMENESLPQHLELNWDKPKKFNTILLTFDTNTGRRENLPLFRYPDCVKDYDLEARNDGEWKTIVSGRDNYHRRCTHRFDAIAADRLRLNVLATNGAPRARVFEIRVYNEA